MLTRSANCSVCVLVSTVCQCVLLQGRGGVAAGVAGPVPVSCFPWVPSVGRLCERARPASVRARPAAGVGVGGFCFQGFGRPTRVPGHPRLFCRTVRTAMPRVDWRRAAVAVPRLRGFHMHAPVRVPYQRQLPPTAPSARAANEQEGKVVVVACGVVVLSVGGGGVYIPGRVHLCATAWRRTHATDDSCKATAHADVCGSNNTNNTANRCNFMQAASSLFFQFVTLNRRRAGSYIPIRVLGWPPTWGGGVCSIQPDSALGISSLYLMQEGGGAQGG